MLLFWSILSEINDYYLLIFVRECQKSEKTGSFWALKFSALYDVCVGHIKVLLMFWIFMICAKISKHKLFLKNLLKISIKFQLGLKIFLEYQVIKLGDQNIILRAHLRSGAK